MDAQAVGLRALVVPPPPGCGSLNPGGVAYPTLSDALLSVDWLLADDEAVSALPPAVGTASALALVASAPAELPPPPLPLPWRCLDAWHAKSCTRCACEGHTARSAGR